MIKSRQTLLYINDDGGCAGYGTIRPCHAGYKIGPLFANSPEIAETLYTHLIYLVPEGVPVFLDIPEPNKDAIYLTEKFQMKEVFETARMHNGEFPTVSIDRAFGITTFELG